MVVRLRDNLILGNARDSRATPVQLGLSASRRNELYVKIIQSGKSPGYPRYCRAGFRISGEHRLPACKFRQLAETEDSIDLRGRTRIAGKLLGTGGLTGRAPRSRSRKSSRSRGRARQHARRVRYPESICCNDYSYSPTLRCKMARAYSRLSLAMKLALISAGHTASHSYVFVQLPKPSASI